jgi:alkaline phosphatase/fibronectin type 3 domain-containing protein
LRIAFPALVLLGVLAAGPSAPALQIVRGPYLQLSHVSGITVRWTTDLASNSTVRFGRASASEFTATLPALVTEHALSLGGLSAGTPYFYRVESAAGSAAAASAEYTFGTAPAARNAAVRFAALADTGDPAVVSALTTRILSEDPDLVLHAGDMQYGDPADRGSWDTYLFGPGKELWARTPLYPCLGNRDYPAAQDPDSTPQLFLDDFTLPGDERFYSFDYGAIHFVALDVYRNSDSSWHLTAAQRSWLTADLSAAQAAPWTVVYFHYPIFSSASSTDRPWEAPLRADLLPIFETYGVDWVIMGHHHLYSRSNRNGISYVITGGGGASPHGVADDPFSVNPHHHRMVSKEFEYLLFDATATRMTLSVRRSDGTEIDRDTKTNVRRNVILLVGDGLGFEHVQAGRLWSGGSDAVQLTLEDRANFPFQGRISTTLPSEAVTDSAAAATAMATGWKTNQSGILSEDGGIRATVLEIARDCGRRTGVVSDAPFVHATPAAFAAHDDSRDHYLDHRWDLLLDDDGLRPDGDHPRSFPEVLLGGGLQDPLYGMDSTYRAQAQAEGYSLVFTRTGLQGLNLNAVGRVMGLLDNARVDGFLQYEKDRLDGRYPGSDEPTLAQMAGHALDLLEEGGKGFFLLVHDHLLDEVSEGRVSDRAAYLGPQVASFSAAARAALDWAASSGRGGETLLLVLGGYETGGLNVPDGQVLPLHSTPAMTWSGTAVTTAPVPVYANWPPGLAGQTLDNTEVFEILRDFLLDGEAPKPVGVTVSGITRTTATVAWTTAEISTSRADFGPTTAYGRMAEDPARVTSHSLTLTGLSPNTLYHLAASSRDLAGYRGSSADLSFTTLPDPPIAPSGLAVVEIPAAGAIDLDWNDSPEDSVVGYRVHRAAAPGGPYVTLNASTILIPRGAVWKYHDRGQDLGTDWRASNYDDAGWAQGPAKLGYGDGDEATLLSYGPDPELKYMTAYFRRTFFVADPSLLTGLTVLLQRDDGAVLYLNGTEAARSNMPTGTIAYGTKAKTSISDEDETAISAISVSAAPLRPGTNLLAIEVHQVTAGSSDLSFDLELLGDVGPIPQNSYRDATAPRGQEVWYAVSAVDWLEQESPLSTARCVWPGPPSAAPAGLTAVVLADRVELDWSNLRDCDLAGYRVDRSLSAGGPYVKLTAGPVASSRYTDTAVQPGMTYYYLVRGVDRSAQAGPPSREVSATMPDAAPPVISGIAPVEISPVSARIIWSTNEPAGSRVDYGPGAGLGGSVSDSTRVLQHSLTLSGLDQGTLYHYQVSSLDSWGNVAAGPLFSFETPTDPYPPFLSGIQAIEVTSSRARIIWTTDEPSDSVVECGPSVRYGQQLISEALVFSHSVTLAGLRPSTTYHFLVGSSDLVKNSMWSGDNVFRTLPDFTQPAPPAGLRASGSDRVISLDWTDNAEGDLAGYRVYRSLRTRGPYDFLAQTSASAHSDAGVLNDTAYYYVITAFDSSGNESGYSAEAFAVPHDNVPPAVPAGLAAQGADEAVLLSWTAGAESDRAGFWIYRSTASGSGFARLNASPLAATSFSDGSVIRGGRYFYRVTAEDQLGNESLPSVEVAAGTPGFYLSFETTVTLPLAGGSTMSVPDEDIVRYDPIARTFTLFFDGSAAGLASSSQNVDAFDILPDGRILISLHEDSSVPGLGAVDESDVLLWKPGAGSRYPGTWSWYFDGSDVGLSGSDEDVDAMMLLPDGRLLLSTTSNASAGGLSWADEDVVAFAFSSAPGETTAGTFAMYLDGSDVGLSELSSEDIGALSPRLDGTGFYLVTEGAYSVPGLPAGTGVDVLLFTPTSLGAASAGSFSLILDGSAIGLPDTAKIDGLDLAP